MAFCRTVFVGAILLASVGATPADAQVFARHSLPPLARETGNGDVVGQAWNLYAVGKVENVFQLFDSVLREQPDLKKGQLFNSWLEAAILSKHFREVYGALQSKHLSFANPESDVYETICWLVAGAELNSSDNRERELETLEKVSNSILMGFRGGAPINLPMPKDVDTLTKFYGYWGMAGYLGWTEKYLLMERALEQCPTNERIARQLTDFYGQLNQGAKLHRVASFLANNLPLGAARDKYAKISRETEGLKDKPLPRFDNLSKA